MRIEPIETYRAVLDRQYNDVHWIAESGLPHEELMEMGMRLQREMQEAGASVGMIRAKTFAMLLERGQIAVDAHDIFQDKLNARDIMIAQTRARINRYYSEEGKPEAVCNAENKEAGSFDCYHDFGHLSVNTARLLKLGFGGLLAELNRARDAHAALTPEQADFYASARITLEAFRDFALRLADAVETENPESAARLRTIALDRPHTMMEAMQMITLHFYLHEFVAGMRIRTLGRLDQMLWPFYRDDLASGRFTREELYEITRYFLNKFAAAKVPFGLPFQLGGIDRDGNEVTNELSEVIVKAHASLDIISPKIHIRISDKTPDSFVRLILRAVRAGQSSYVFGNDRVVMEGLRRVGIAEEDARDYTFIGCYEPAVYAHEIGCTGNGKLNAAKMVEFVFTRGIDHRSGKRLAPDTGEVGSYEEFIGALKAQIRWAVEWCLGAVRKVERHYPEIMADPLLSSMLEESVESGTDIFAGSARYNNSSLYFVGLATLVDSVAAVKRLVFEEKRVSFDEMRQILEKNWEGAEDLRREALRLPQKYGTGNAEADEIMIEFAHYAASLITGQPNGRGGVFKASNFSIDNYVKLGGKTMATPDGRRTGDVISKNLSPSAGMDRGVTALIRSVTKMDFTEYPNGTVLDIILHPSAVAGEDGLDAFHALLKTYFARGGIAMHGNVFDAETLRRAQAEPEKYANLQVRVCGWNAYFTDLTREEQEDFIKKAELALE